MTQVTLAVDAMGGDTGLSVTVPAVARILERHRQLRVVLAGDRAGLEQALKDEGLGDEDRVRIQPASQIVEMDDPVAVALRSKRDSSMRVALNLVRDAQADAAVSAGNTGALMAVSRFVLKTLPGVDRPAICTAIPARKGHFHMLDLGANVDSGAGHLLQFALMGAAVVRAVDGVETPAVALLNIGEEEIKGSEVVREAATLLSGHPAIDFRGYVEGTDIFSGDVDVVVCDGFVGNVALKSIEGTASMIGTMIREEIDRSWLRKLSGLFALPLLKALRKRMNPDHYNGASLVGLNGIVVKSHGGVGVEGFLAALEVALLEAERNVPALIGDALQSGDGVVSAAAVSEDS